MSDKKGLPPNSPYGAAPPGVGYAQMTAAAPPSYMESLSHPVVASPHGAPPQYPAQYTATSAAAAASAQQLQMYYDSLQSMAAAQQAQKVAYAQQQAYPQQAASMYLQQQAAYAQQVPGYYGLPAHALQPGQNVLVVNGFDAGARFDGVGQQSIPAAPPGIAPNAAQLAAAAGAQVSATQKKGSFLSGGSGGGYTFW